MVIRGALTVAVGTEAAGHTASTYRLQRKIGGMPYKLAGMPG